MCRRDETASFRELACITPEASQADTSAQLRGQLPAGLNDCDIISCDVLNGAEWPICSGNCLL